MPPESGLYLQGGRFQKGQSDNPKGKPKGAEPELLSYMIRVPAFGGGAMQLGRTGRG